MRGNLFAQVRGSLATLLMRTNISGLHKQVNKWKRRGSRSRPGPGHSTSTLSLQGAKQRQKKGEKHPFHGNSPQRASPSMSPHPSDGLSAVSAAITTHQGGGEEEEVREGRGAHAGWGQTATERLSVCT